MAGSAGQRGGAYLLSLPTDGLPITMSRIQ